MTETSAVLAGMFTENTGTHMLDSGGAYGRGWQRNQGKIEQDFLDAPAAYWNYGPTLSTFHYLNNNLTFSPVMDRLFSIFTVDSEESYFADVDAFAKHMAGNNYHTFNSYNWETFLDTVVQWTEFEYNNITYILLSVHGGADVRGGYTRARVFEADSWDCWYGMMMDAEVFCNSGKLVPTGEFADETVSVMGVDTTTSVKQFDNCSYYLSVRGSDISDMHGNFIDTPEDFWDAEIRCPDCGEPMTVNMMEY